MGNQERDEIQAGAGDRLALACGSVDVPKSNLLSIVADQMGSCQRGMAQLKGAQSNPQLSNEEKIKSAINVYFTTRYEGQKLLLAQDFSQLLEDNTLSWVQKEKDKREIELYLASLFNLKYVSYNYTLDYDSLEIKNNKAVVQLRENHTVVFEALAPDVSKLASSCPRNG